VLQSATHSPCIGTIGGEELEHPTARIARRRNRNVDANVRQEELICTGDTTGDPGVNAEPGDSLRWLTHVSVYGRVRTRHDGSVGPRPLQACARAVVSAGLLLASGPALANGRFPTANQLVVQPGKPQVMALRTTFGVLLSTDAAKDWLWICESAIGYGMIQSDPAVGFTAGGALLAGTVVGLAVSPDTGCSWAFAGGALDGAVTDVAVRPGSPHAALALASAAAGSSAAGVPLFTTQLYSTTDDGAHWAAYGTPLDPTVLVTTVEVAASDPHRVYVSGLRNNPTTTASLFVSTNDGQAWAERPLPLDPATEQAAYIAAVDPGDEDRVYVRTGLAASRLLVTDDAGVTVRSVFSGGPMLGFALSPDGTTVYLGGPADGLQSAKTADLQFTQRSTFGVGCLTLVGTVLYACDYDQSVLLAASTNGGVTFSPVLRLKDLEGPLSCPAGTTSTQCVAEWPLLRQMYSIGATDAGPDAAGSDGGAGGDAGAGDAGSSQTPPPAASPRGTSCRCGPGAPPGTSAPGVEVAAVVALAVVRRRARRAARRPSST